MTATTTTIPAGCQVAPTFASIDCRLDPVAQRSRPEQLEPRRVAEHRVGSSVILRARILSTVVSLSRRRNRCVGLVSASSQRRPLYVVEEAINLEADPVRER